MGEYHNNYLKKGVLLSADVFVKFVNESLDYYKLDPSHYLSSPGLSWDAMLKITGIKLDLISTLTCTVLLKEGWEELIHTSLKGLAEKITSTRKVMILQKKVLKL